MSETPHCYRHPGRETLVSCSECGRPICEECMNFAPVGIKCPDHAGVGAARPSPQRTMRTAKRKVGGLDAPATVALLAINVLVYVLTVAQGGGVSQPGGELYEKGGLFVSFFLLPGQGLAEGEWWRLVSAMFLHGSLIHLAFNMFALYLLGTIVEQLLGTWRFLLLYFASGIAGSAGALLLDPYQFTVGASGAIWGVMGALLILEYMATGSLAGQAMTLIVVNLVITFAIPNISIGGHLGGLAGGIAAALALAKLRYRRPTYLAPAAVLAVGLIGVVVAYARVQGLT